nr:MAG TPA: Recombination endonuclease VII [Caudoviricetes sp.]
MTPLADRKPCIDCTAEGRVNKRATPYPGPRCATHHGLEMKRRKQASRERSLMKRFGITMAEYEAIYEHQGGVCYICRRATGKSRALAVDHDHETGYIRGLLCSSCNKGVIGHLRDSVETLQRAITYLEDPPAQQVIGKRVAPQ